MSDVTITALITAIAGVIGGGTVGAGLTGTLAIRQKKMARKHKNRGIAYAEAITWMRLSMTAYRTGQASWPPASPTAGGPGRFVSPLTSAKFPFSVPAADADIGLGSQYFAVLRAQVITFATHDMARAFDRWVDAFAEVLQHGQECRCLILDDKLDGVSERTRQALAGMTCYDAIFPRAGDPPRPGTTDPVHWRHTDLPDGYPGCLTRAVEYCASWELRKG